MPQTLLLPLIGAALLLTPAMLFCQGKLGRRDSALPGLLALTAMAAVSYAAFGLAVHRYGWGWGLTALALLHLPVLAGGIFYLVLRYARYRQRALAVARNRRKQRPPLVASPAFRRQLEHFSCLSPLTPEQQREVLILLHSHGNKQKIADLYNTSLEEVERIQSSFDSCRLPQTPAKTPAKGVDYTVGSEQAAFFRQLMITSTPKSLNCGDSLLWSEEALRKLIRLSAGVTPNRASVQAFMNAEGLTQTRQEYQAAVSSPEVRRWIETEYQKIRLSALEQNCRIFWLYVKQSSARRRGLVILAVSEERTLSFGLYKSGGFTDFLNKLAQEHAGGLYVVAPPEAVEGTGGNLSPEITLFALGEPARFPDPAVPSAKKH